METGRTEDLGFCLVYLLETKVYEVATPPLISMCRCCHGSRLANSNQASGYGLLTRKYVVQGVPI
jgi:hypothetical protein